MQQGYWQRQGSKPLFPELEWNKPERRDQAGKLLIIGGSSHALTAPIKAYEAARRQGAGEIRLLLPDKTKRLLTQGQSPYAALRSLSGLIEFLPSTSSGEFAQEGSDQIVWHTQWADTVLIAGDSGRNSQTSVLLESLLSSYTGRVLITKDAIESLYTHPGILLDREHTAIVASFGQLQRLFKAGGVARPLQFAMDLVPLVYYLQEYSAQHSAAIITVHQGQLIAAQGGDVVSTKISQQREKHWRLTFAAIASCYQTWNPEKQLEALAHSAHVLEQAL